MKNIILTTTLFLFVSLSAFSQYVDNADSQNNLFYEVKGKYTRPVKKEKLVGAKLISDFISGYPSSWITSYISAEISVINNGKNIKLIGTEDALTLDQKNALKTADIGTDVVVNVKYNTKNPVSNVIEKSNMSFTVTVVPDVQAEYAGGYNQMIKYLKEKITSKIPEATLKKYQNIAIKFTINENGEAINAIVTKTSTDSKTDKVLLDIINDMPKWKPAENNRGEKVKQEFVFGVGNRGC